MMLLEGISCFWSYGRRIRFQQTAEEYDNALTRKSIRYYFGPSAQNYQCILAYALPVSDSFKKRAEQE